MNIKKKPSYPIVMAILALLSCSTEVTAMEIDIDKSVVSQNFKPRNQQVLVLHCVGYPDDWVFKNYVFPSAESLPEEGRGLGVSAHYYISQEKNGKIYQLVDEANSAFHAGVSDWRSLAKNNQLIGLNNISIGIEFQSPGYAQIDGKAYYPYSFAKFSDEQINNGIILSKQIMQRHNISRENVVWHSDIAPLRRGQPFGKTDPGAFFDGKRLAKNGIGVWPLSDRLEDSQMDTSLKNIQQGFQDWGYPHVQPTGLFDEETKYVLGAHYMHYLPTEINWEDYKDQTAGPIFGKDMTWENFPYAKEPLAISLENLNKKHFIAAEE